MILNPKRILFYVLFFAIGMVLTACSEPAPEVTVDDRVDQLETNLVEDGASAEVAQCVARLAEYDLRSGEVNALVLDELVLNCERAENILDGQLDNKSDNEDARTLAFVEGPNVLGDDPDLDRLWRACADGSGLACDDLFQQSPVGSEYEQFGVSCGERNDIVDCVELDELKEEAST